MIFDKWIHYNLGTMHKQGYDTLEVQIIVYYMVIAQSRLMPHLAAL